MSNNEIKLLSATSHYSEDIVRMFVNQYGLERAKKLIEYLKKPVKFYSLRVNTLKTSSEKLAAQFESEGLSVKVDEKLPEVIYLPVKGPFKLPEADKKVVADKFRS
ncbi:MAG: hypothetical protein ACTSSJ_03200 [Candidatus Odinarchaeia archaeon]